MVSIVHKTLPITPATWRLRFFAGLALPLFLLGVAADAAPKKAPETKKPRIVEPAEPPGPKAPRMPARFNLLREGELPLAAKGATVVDGLTAKPLYEKNAEKVFYSASTTKIMTALLVIEAGDLEREVEITPEDAAVGESSLHIKVGERFTRRQMLFGLMLKSANDVAHALGRDNAGTAAAFAEKNDAASVGTRRDFDPLHECARAASSAAFHHGTRSRADRACGHAAAVFSPGREHFEASVGDGFALRELRNHNRLLTQFPAARASRPATPTRAAGARKRRMRDDAKSSQW
jgi:hypothetical protein